MSLPPVVSRDEWLVARKELLAREKQLTRERDALNAERRRLPMIEIDKEYVFEGPEGKATLLDLFEGRGQLIIYHLMWRYDRDLACLSCSAFVDQIGHLAHLRARDTTFAAVSRAPVAKIEPFKARMGWTSPGTHRTARTSTTTSTSRWTSPLRHRVQLPNKAEIEQTGLPIGEWEQPFELHGLSVFLRDSDRAFTPTRRTRAAPTTSGSSATSLT
jgi:predicted dithiol-disulfide oxidoreductase (DUF899 family)